MEGDGDRAALPSGSSHATEHSRHELLFMYGECTGLKCLDQVNYSLFCPAEGGRREEKMAERCIQTPPVATAKKKRKRQPSLACKMWQNNFNYRGEAVVTVAAAAASPVARRC